MNIAHWHFSDWDCVILVEWNGTYTNTHQMSVAHENATINEQWIINCNSFIVFLLFSFFSSSFYRTITVGCRFHLTVQRQFAKWLTFGLQSFGPQPIFGYWILESSMSKSSILIKIQGSMINWWQKVTTKPDDRIIFYFLYLKNVYVVRNVKI